MVARIEGNRQWLPAMALILWILGVCSFPFVIGISYSGRSEAPEHVLTYTEGKLTWDSATGIRADGSAQLDLFDAKYSHVEAADGANIVAPGTGSQNIVRLKNAASGSVTYTAVLYLIRTDNELPVSAGLSGEGFTDTVSYPLPDTVGKKQVIRAVTGTLNGGKIQDFDIRWLWDFSNGEASDLLDTYLGDKAALTDADNVSVGLYIVVEDQNSAAGKSGYVSPDSPKTGDVSGSGMYAGLLCVSGLVMILLLAERRWEKK